jgi:glycine/D-amino acid oxidase-like deaminating enzyme
MRVVVVGAGIAGLSVARALLDRGCRPTVIARDGGATAAGAGILSAQFADPVLRPLALRSREIVASLVPVRRCGMAQIALSPRTATRVERIEGGRRGLPAALRACFRPEFLRRVVAARFSADELWVDPARLRAALARGLRVVRDDVLDVEEDVVAASRRWHEADHVVLALGAAGLGMLPEVGLRPRRTQLARLSTPLPAMFHVLDTGLYARPDGAGSVVGDGDEPWDGREGEPATAPTPEFLEHVRGEAARVLRRPGTVRGLGGGVIAATRSRRPVVLRGGNVWILAGLGGDGLALAPALGERIADRILERPARP